VPASIAALTLSVRLANRVDASGGHFHAAPTFASDSAATSQMF
jgi:hypothetical protein